MHNKIRIIAEKDAIIQLSFNKEFNEGRVLKYIFRILAEILLIMDEAEFDSEWSNSESELRKFLDRKSVV